MIDYLIGTNAIKFSLNLSYFGASLVRCKVWDNFKSKFMVLNLVLSWYEYVCPKQDKENVFFMVGIDGIESAIYTCMPLRYFFKNFLLLNCIKMS